MPSPFELSDDAAQPVISALNRACAKNWQAFSNTVMKLSIEASRPAEVRLSEADAVRMLECAISHLKNVQEIGRWIVPRTVLPIEEALEKARTFRELGDDWAEDIFSRLQKLSQGRPPTKRLSHIQTFEYMLQSKKNSLGRAVPKFCACGKVHGPECYQQLKAGIHYLNKLLRKYAPDLRARYDALHPDRAEKTHGMISKSSGFSPHHQ